VRSIVEGITYAMKDSLEIIRSMGIVVEEVRLSGGGARNEFWRQMQADVYESAVCTINADEGPAYGVALLAGVGTGVWGSVEEACEQSISTVSRHEVQPENVRVYREYYPLFQSLYRSLKGDFAAITGRVARLSG
jgi:xylulokinase